MIRYPLRVYLRVFACGSLLTPTPRKQIALAGGASGPVPQRAESMRGRDDVIVWACRRNVSTRNVV